MVAYLTQYFGFNAASFILAWWYPDPQVVVQIWEGVKALDTKLLEMAQTARRPKVRVESTPASTRNLCSWNGPEYPFPGLKDGGPSKALGPDEQGEVSDQLLLPNVPDEKHSGLQPGHDPCSVESFSS